MVISRQRIGGNSGQQVALECGIEGPRNDETKRGCAEPKSQGSVAARESAVVAPSQQA